MRIPLEDSGCISVVLKFEYDLRGLAACSFPWFAPAMKLREVEFGIEFMVRELKSSPLILHASECSHGSGYLGG